jgi:hypothetical protein
MWVNREKERSERCECGVTGEKEESEGVNVLL